MVLGGPAMLIGGLIMAAIAVTFCISFVKKETRMTPARIWETLRLSGYNMIMIALACAGAGMVVAIALHAANDAFGHVYQTEGFVDR